MAVVIHVISLKLKLSLCFKTSKIQKQEQKTVLPLSTRFGYNFNSGEWYQEFVIAPLSTRFGYNTLH